ncbi:UDP-N-acetylmuramate--L-alanine ligase [Haloechinothrix sp. YIM 98757]|uniref:UDP-N-acetylmuramate--L-alanine ligase n=1 Tax=Haloechinothrix aidingensis TaxID=2752311 RepID=A0A838A1E7_9PSEU|nr:UDP-N-acetylmuramate--L-alanine ligase [Haloechinothrix aidingensis]MBA0124963.1 UDP-N-acetylmuramate--L-alanine ligase [Haloechinothrix aidingensis]
MPVPERLRRAHLIGIGGAGMSGIARILLARGGTVSGSDAKDSRAFMTLRAQGAVIAIGQDARNLDGAGDEPTAVIVSTAIKESNPELAAARARGITVLHRADALALLMDGHTVACITGTHGKTSTTSMLTVALQHCRLDPSFAIGGDLNESGANAHHGSGGMFVAEADESDGSFLSYAPSVAVITNIEPDHLDHHGTSEAYGATFEGFVSRIRAGGVLVVCSDDPEAERLAREAGSRGLLADGVRVRRYGRTATGFTDARVLDYTAGGDEGGSVRLEMRGEEFSLTVPVAGEHMAFNAVAALLAGEELGAPQHELLEGLAAFSGVSRRFEFKGRAGAVRVYDDYAHHPTEVAAQLRAARHAADRGRVLVVFQPHLYSRTAAFAGEFAAALGLADEVVTLDVYGAREEPVPGVTGALISDRITGAVAHYEPAFDRAAELAAGLARPGDLLITMGAGDVTQLGPEIIRQLDDRDTVPAVVHAREE